MNYKEAGFRAFYHHFCVLPITKKTEAALADFPGAKKANGVLTYGYYDREAGLTLEILAAAQVECDSVSFGETSMETRSFIRIETVAEDDFLFFSDEDGSLAKRYADKIEILHHYDADEEVEKTREMSLLDGCRDENYIDDVLVYLIKEGNQPEGCWTRIIGLGNNFLMGILLNEPEQDFDYHKGEKIAFFVQETEEKRIICCSDMNPSKKITAEDLEDGTMLEAAVTKFNAERNEPNFVELLEILRDSYVWVPCTAVLSDEDQARLVPDILLHDEEFFFPIFTNEEAMGEYGNGFSKVQKHILEVIPLARNNDKDLAGIVLNPCSEPFVLDKEIWDIVENMKSRIQ